MDASAYNFSKNHDNWAFILTDIHSEFTNSSPGAISCACALKVFFREGPPSCYPTGYPRLLSR